MRFVLLLLALPLWPADDANAILRRYLVADKQNEEKAEQYTNVTDSAWFVRDKKSFVTLWADGHHDNHFAHLWCAGLPGAQTSLIAADPGRFFRPPYVGGRGWIGVRLDGAGPVDWTEVAELCEDAYRAVAPAGLIARL